VYIPSSLSEIVHAIHLKQDRRITLSQTPDKAISLSPLSQLTPRAAQVSAI